MNAFGPRRVGLFALGVAVVSGWVGCDPGPAQWQGPTTSSLGDVDLDLGTVGPGSKISGTLQVANKTNRAWRIDRVETSCTCLMVKPGKFEVAGGGSFAANVVFDPASKPDFRGNLLVEVVGREADGDVIFTSRVAIAVEN